MKEENGNKWLKLILLLPVYRLKLQEEEKEYQAQLENYSTFSMSFYIMLSIYNTCTFCFIPDQ